MTSSDLLGLAGRWVVVAGAGAGGIGEAVATTLTAAGARVIGLDRDEARLAGTADRVRAAGGEWRGAVVDACDPEQVGGALGALDVDLATGSLAGLVHVVGGMPRDRWAPFADYPLVWLDEVLRHNLTSTVVTSQVASRLMLAAGQGGAIVHISSLAGMAGMPYAASYSAAKAAVMSLTRSMAVELGGDGIRVNCVAPGTIRTVRSADATDDAARQVIPLRRRGLPADIAGAVVYLLSDLAAFVSGQVLAVDGGSSVRPSYLDADGLPVFVQDLAVRDQMRGLG